MQEPKNQENSDTINSKSEKTSKKINLKFKEINKTEKFKDTNFLKNPRINKIMEQYSNLYSNNLKKKYNQITNEIILENIKSIEDKISQMKNSLKKIEFSAEENFLQEKNDIKNTQKISEISEIFDLSKFSISKIQENLKNLTPEEKLNLKIQIEHSFFYININIDKAFEIFMEKLDNQKIEIEKNLNLNNLLKEYCHRFVSRILELDRIIYVRKNKYIFS